MTSGEWDMIFKEVTDKYGKDAPEYMAVAVGCRCAVLRCSSDFTDGKKDPASRAARLLASAVRDRRRPRFGKDILEVLGAVKEKLKARSIPHSADDLPQLKHRLCSL